MTWNSWQKNYLKKGKNLYTMISSLWPETIRESDSSLSGRWKILSRGRGHDMISRIILKLERSCYHLSTFLSPVNKAYLLRKNSIFNKSVEDELMKMILNFLDFLAPLLLENLENFHAVLLWFIRTFL